MRYRFYMGAPVSYIVHLVAHINLKEFPLVHQRLNGPLPSSQAQSKVEILQGSPNIKLECQEIYLLLKSVALDREEGDHQSAMEY
ncbi:hypothetical protein RHGRI_013887 [Rhododendron griersonianum]|uniref:Uncharacterized protein n=1 Tax=Rhododendron griersonianum TaxID=479676 RepID=A0AAV6K7B2_9ERIC|nr:hypothetical protein RHGRI_013887 [Rhododendron griersonianum]